MIEDRFARLRAVIAAWKTWEAERGKEFRDLFERGDEPAIRRLMDEMRTLRRRRRALEAFVQRWADSPESLSRPPAGPSFLNAQSRKADPAAHESEGG